MNRKDAHNSLRVSPHSFEADQVASLIQWGETLEEINAKTPTLRDYFAIEALNGIISNDGLWCRGKEEGLLAKKTAHQMAAEYAYSIADTMMEARKK